MATDKMFKVGGVSNNVGGYKVRFANDMTRVKVLSKTGADVQLIELPTEMTKGDVVKFLMQSDLYKNAAYVECIDSANAKYNPVAKTATVKVKKEKAPKAAKPSLDAIKSRAKKAVVAEVAADAAE